MDMQTANILVRATSEFYMAQCESFSNTRQSAWDGWEKLVDMANPLPQEMNVLDLGCGNMRFEEFLKANLSDRFINAYAYDSCTRLADLGNVEFREHFHELDIMKALAKDTLLERLRADCPLCDLSVAFGFMHHVPLKEWRKGLIRTLVEMTAPGGLACVAFWQLGNSEKLLHKAQDITPIGCAKLGIELDEACGDYLLDWQENNNVYRYVHDFNNEEIDYLMQIGINAGAQLIKTYNADGKTGNLNRYVILRRNAN